MTGNTELRAPDFSDIEAAARRLHGLLVQTPVLRHPELEAKLGCQAYLKCENRQQTGSFKMRGASNAIALLREAGDVRDVATHSSGNHGAALALAARRDGRAAHVVMPHNSVPAKLEAVRRYGGDVLRCAPTQSAREAGLARLVARGMVAIPPYEHP